jgi:acyl carrier protein
MDNGLNYPAKTGIPHSNGALGVRAKVREIISQHGRLSAAVDQLSDTSDLYAAGLTSLATVGLMLALEEGFDIEFPDAMLSRKTFGSIDALASAVERLAAASGQIAS